MQVLKYSVLIVTFFAEVWIGENKQEGDFSAAGSGYRLPSPEVTLNPVALQDIYVFFLELGNFSSFWWCELVIFARDSFM